MQKRIGITGASGFIGRNLVSWLGARSDLEVIALKRPFDLEQYDKCDAIIHLSAMNRGFDSAQMFHTNVVQTMDMLHWAMREKKRLCIAGSEYKLGIFAATKGICEQAVRNLSPHYVDATYVKLPHVFGPHCQPHYNSFVTTIMHSIAHEKPFWNLVKDAHEQINLIHVDDVCAVMERMVRSPVRDLIEEETNKGMKHLPVYQPWHAGQFRINIKDFVLVAQGAKCERYSYDIHKRIQKVQRWYHDQAQR